MPNPPIGKRLKKPGLLRPFMSLFSRRSPTSYQRAPQSVSAHNASASMSAPQDNPQGAKYTAIVELSTMPSTSASPTNSATSAPQVNPQGTEYTAILERSTTPSGPLTWERRMKECGSTAYEGLKTIIQGIYDCSSSFPPLQTAAGVLLMISNTVDRVSANRIDLEQLGVKLQSILSIIGKYRDNGGLRALDYRVEDFCLAIDLQIDEVEKLYGNSLWSRTLKGTKDAETVLKVFRNISSLCDVFQIDTQLHTEVKVKVEEIFKRLESRSIDKLGHEITSYKTRHSSYGNPTGCMAGTRVKILADLEAWASDDRSSKVYWLVGMAGTGKSTILHTLCEILDRKNMLGASFFSSRGSENTRNARLIVPTIAHSLASTSPCIKSEVVKAIENDPKLAEPTCMNLVGQFNRLIHDPIQVLVGNTVKIYKIIVIDAIDECTDLPLVSSLIQLVLESTSTIPLKVFITSRDEPPIRRAFTSLPRLRRAFYLHELDKDVAKGDIRIYLEKSLAEIKAEHGHTLDTWPPPSEISALLDYSRTLFIYAATAIRYISQGGPHYQSRLSAMANRDIKSASKLQTSMIDGLYEYILDQACESKEEGRLIPMRQLVSMIVFLRNPLPIQAISSLSERDAYLYLSPLTSVIHIPTHEDATVTPFHTSFPDFITNSTRCSRKRDPLFSVLVASECHEMLALKCLEQMNRSLKYNICEVSKELTLSRREATNFPDNRRKISEALKYSCLYWSSHFSEAQLSGVDLIDALDTFLHTHLLHWIECLSELGKLETGISSLRSAATVLSQFKSTNIRCHELQLLIDDGCQCLQMNFACIEKHSFEIYESSLVWIPMKSLIRNVYSTEVSRVPRVIVGLPEWWGSAELYMQKGSIVNSVAFSQDGNQVVSGSNDNTIRIWNVTTGEVEAELKGHTGCVISVVFARNGSRVVSRSCDRTVQIWDTMVDEVEATKLKGHTNWVTSVALAHDGSQVVSGSDDKIWNAMADEVETVLKGHMELVKGSQNVSGLHNGTRDKKICIWNATRGEVEVELKGHRDWVTSVVFSQDVNKVVPGSSDNTVQVWNPMMGEVEAVLKDHTSWVTSIAFAQDGRQVATGLSDNTVQNRNTTMGEVETELKGNTGWVAPIAFVQDDSQVVSKSEDKTVCIQNAAVGEVEAVLKGHIGWVMSVAFTQDGSQVVSKLDDKTVQIWNTVTGKLQLVMTATTITLPDASAVHSVGEGDFHISYIDQPSTTSIHGPLSISDDHEWIMGALHDCWIPSHNRDFISSSISGDRVCFGYSSGNVTIFDMKAAQ